MDYAFRIRCDLIEKPNAQLVITAYPITSGKRLRKEIIFNFNDVEVCEKLHNEIRKRITRPKPPHLLKSKPNNKVLIITNPFSGQKKALQLWNNYGAHVLQEAQLEFDLIMTERPGHGTEIAQTLRIDDYDAIAVNSGDGLISEVICGLLLRKDRERALKIPICHIPGGTSNGLAASILFACNEPFSARDVFITECVNMLVHPIFINLPLFTVETEQDGLKPMFMTATWGLIADIDIGSERFRWAGMARLHIEAILRILQLPTVAKYNAKVSYVPVNDKETSRKSTLSYDVDRSRFGDKHFTFDSVTEASSEVSSKDPSQGFTNINEALEGHGNEYPKLNEPLGPEWETVEGCWAMVNVTSTSHLGSDLPYMPAAQLDKDIIYLTLLDWNTIKSRFHVADLFIRMNNCIHLSYPCLQIIPVKAVRVEPQTKSGYFAIDGEPCTNGSAFQVFPFMHKATIIGRNK
ncbi:unnamed protein product [Auanema sp. JU1783]|nr:unnamed protein product [Auanema sp. JU1783]